MLATQALVILVQQDDLLPLSTLCCLAATCRTLESCTRHRKAQLQQMSEIYCRDLESQHWLATQRGCLEASKNIAKCASANNTIFSLVWPGLADRYVTAKDELRLDKIKQEWLRQWPHCPRTIGQLHALIERIQAQ